MSEHRSTYEMAAPHIEPYVQPLWPGAVAMPFDLRDETGRRIAMADDHLSGKHLLLLFLNDAREEAALPLMKVLAGRYDDFERLAATVVAISADSDSTRNRALKAAAGFPWPVAADPTGAVFASYGLHKWSDRAAADFASAGPGGAELRQQQSLAAQRPGLPRKCAGRRRMRRSCWCRTCLRPRSAAR